MTTTELMKAVMDAYNDCVPHGQYEMFEDRLFYDKLKALEKKVKA